MVRTKADLRGAPIALPASTEPAQPYPHLQKSPFQHAPPGRLFSVREAALKGYDRPGLATQTPLDVQLGRLDAPSSTSPKPAKLLDSVRTHPTRTGPIGKDLPSVEALWPDLGRKGRVRAQATVEGQMNQFMVQQTDGGRRMPLLDKIMDPKLPLSLSQRNRIKQCFGEYWNSLQELRPFDLKASDENWCPIPSIDHDAVPVFCPGSQPWMSA